MKMKIIYRNYYIYTFGCDEKNIRKTNNFQELIKCWFNWMIFYYIIVGRMIIP